MPPETLQTEGGALLANNPVATPVSQPQEVEPPQEVAPTPPVPIEPEVGVPTGNVSVLSDQQARDQSKIDVADLQGIREGLQLAETQALEIQKQADLLKEKQDAEKEAKAQGGLTFDEAKEIFGTDFTGVIQDPSSGLFIPDESAQARVDPQEKVIIDQQKAVDDAFDSQIALLDQTRINASVASQAVIDSIKASYEVRRTELKNINQRTLEAQRILGIRSGRQQFAGEIQIGILSAEESAGIQRLAILDAQERSLIADAEAAQTANDFTLLNAKMNLIRENEIEKLNILKEQANASLELENQARERLRQVDFENSIFGLLDLGISNPAQIASLLGMPISEVADVLKNIPANETSIDLTGQAKEFQSFVNIGLIDSTLSKQDQWNKFIDLTTEDKLLSVEEAKKLGVPFGTTESQAFGRFAIQEPKTGKPPTGSQFQAGTFAKRIELSESQLSGGRERFFPFAPQFAKTEDRRLFEQAERNFINALLRRESGAAIAETEFDSARLQYIPLVTDPQDVLELKAQNRKIVFEGLRLESGDAFELLSEQVGGVNAFDPEVRELLDLGYTLDQIQEIKKAK